MQRSRTLLLSSGPSGPVLLFLLVLTASAHAQIISTAAGSTDWGGIADVALDAQGNMYIPDYNKHVVYKVDKLASATVVAGSGTAGYGGDGAQATAAKIYGPLGAAVDAGGNIYIAEYLGHRIRKVAPDGIITTFAGTGVGGFTGDGGPATSARIYYPIDIIVDNSGNVIFADGGNNRIRKIAADGTITTIAGTGRRVASADGSPALATDMLATGIAFGPDGSLYFTDGGWRLQPYGPKVRKIGSNGLVTTIAGTGTRGHSGDGGPATAATFQSADGVAVDATGTVYVSDFAGCRIRKIATNGIITTLAGDGRCGLAGDGGDSTQARVDNPIGMVVDAGGNLLITDYGNRRIRKITGTAPVLPAINETTAGVSAFAGRAGFSSNTYLEIYGTNLAQTTRLWSGSDFTGVNAPTTLDGVSVTVNGKPAFVNFVSPNQVNINTPDDTATGPVLIRVTNSVGTSNTGAANRTRLSPALHTGGSFLIGGKQHVIAHTADFRYFIGNPGMIAGLEFVTAKPGDRVIIYALGCGPTNPATQAGILPAQNSPMTLPYEVKIGGTVAPVEFAGMIAGNIGLYQFNVVIPIVPAGDQPVELTVDGVANGQNLVIAVGR